MLTYTELKAAWAARAREPKVMEEDPDYSDGQAAEDAERDYLASDGE